MKRLVEFSVEGSANEGLIVEVDDPGPEFGEERASRRDAIERADQSLDEALRRIQPAASALLGKLRGLAEPPDEVQIEFGVKLTGKAGAVLASASASANYRVTLTWTRKEPTGAT